MMYLKNVISAILFCTCLYSQINVSLNKIINLPGNIANNDFQSTNLSVSQTGFYLLDSENRQIAFLSNDGKVVLAGGYGIDNDAFIDPINILSSKLRVWVIDRTENKLIEFDHKLNFIRTIEFDLLYPEFSGIDDWGNILLLSKQEQMVFKTNPQIESFDEFIDLSILNDVNNCIAEMYVASDGNLGIFTKCNNSVKLFNRLGKIEKIFPIKDTDGTFLIKLSNEWFVINSAGQITSIRYNEKVELPIEQNILDVAQMDGLLYILFSDKIWVVDVTME